MFLEFYLHLFSTFYINLQRVNEILVEIKFFYEQHCQFYRQKRTHLGYCDTNIGSSVYDVLNLRGFVVMP